MPTSPKLFTLCQCWSQSMKCRFLYRLANVSMNTSMNDFNQNFENSSKHEHFSSFSIIIVSTTVVTPPTGNDLYGNNNFCLGDGCCLPVSVLSICTFPLTHVEVTSGWPRPYLTDFTVDFTNVSVFQMTDLLRHHATLSLFPLRFTGFYYKSIMHWPCLTTYASLVCMSFIYSTAFVPSQKIFMSSCDDLR